MKTIWDIKRLFSNILKEVLQNVTEWHVNMTDKKKNSSKLTIKSKAICLMLSGTGLVQQVQDTRSNIIAK